MDKERVLAIGIGANFRASTFCHPPNLAEFSAVIWHPKSIIGEWQQQALVAVSVKRCLELTEWIKEGNVLVTVGAPPEHFKGQYIQNSRGVEFDFLKSELFSGISFRHTSGALVEYCGPDELSDLISRFADLARYDAVMAATDLTPLFRVSKPSISVDQVVGAYRKLGKGIVIFIPPLGKGDAQDYESYYLAAASILELLREPAGEQTPDWLPQFQTPPEQDASQKISIARRNIQDIEAEIVKFNRQIFFEQSGKLLFTATGDAFVNAVAEALRELGLKVIEGPKQRADLIAWDGNRLAAIEAKGLEGAAREKNIGQVKRWTADISVARSSTNDDIAGDAELSIYQSKLLDLGVPLELPDDESECKGIAILGTFRKKPIDQRPEAFNDPVIRVIVRSGVCALTGLQLYTLVRDARANPSAREQIVNKLFATNGVLENGLTWQDYLRKIA
jgi:hypothetical protein